MKDGASKSLKAERLAELMALAVLPDDAIDTSDAPELLDWSGAKRGLFMATGEAAVDPARGPQEEGPPS
jgi:hypothetical protein